jgi:DNA-binding response OmpR family regulator
METPLWDVDPLPSLLFDPDSQRAQRFAARLRGEGLPVELAPSAMSMLAAVRDKHFRVPIVAADVDDPDCLAFLEKPRKAAPESWMIALTSSVDHLATLTAYRHGVDAVVILSASHADLRARIAGFQLRARPSLFRYRGHPHCEYKCRYLDSLLPDLSANSISCARLSSPLLGRPNRQHVNSDPEVPQWPFQILRGQARPQASGRQWKLRIDQDRHRESHPFAEPL